MADSNYSPIPAAVRSEKIESMAGSSERNNNFNFLRLVFAVLVLLSHSPEIIDGNRSREILTRIFGTMSFGELAVNGFFLLSGYMIIKSWINNPELKGFMMKRVARIYPGFLVATLLSIYLFGSLGANSISTYLQELSYPRCLAFAALLMGPPTPEVFKGTYHPVVNGAMWTLSYEFRCYVFVAILGVYGINSSRKKWLIILLSTMVLLFSFYFFDVDYYHFPGSFYILGIPSQTIRFLFYFATGACFYLYRKEIKYKTSWALVSLALLTVCMFYQTIAAIAFSLLGGYCIFFFSFRKIGILKIFQRLPDISYGLYLYGWPVQKVLLWYFPLLSPWALFAFAWIIAAVFGLLSWKIVESPVLQLLAKHRSTSKELTPGIVSV